MPISVSSNLSPITIGQPLSSSTMLSSMDSSQSPVAIPAPASPSSKSYNEPARLCGSCCEAHETLLCDDGPDWYRASNDSGSLWLHDDKTRSRNLPGDEWPDLPRLSKSAKEGCEFCGILQQAILSKRFIDTCEHLSKGSSACSSKKTLDLDIHYEKTTTSVLSWPRCGGTQDMFLIVKATFNGGSAINMHFEIEADPSKGPFFCGTTAAFIFADSQLIFRLPRCCETPRAQGSAYT